MMAKKEHSTNAAICSIIRSRPKRIRRSRSRTSLDVKGSFVMKKLWLFEGMDKNPIQVDSEDQLSDRDTGKDEWCSKHSWFLFTNLSCSQHCAKCTKRILPHRATYKCTACKKLCHLRCAIKSGESPTEEKTNDKNSVEMSNLSTSTKNRNRQKLNTQTRNFARLRKQFQKQEEEEEAVRNEQEWKKKSDLNSSIQSQAKQKLTTMKDNIMKRCKSLKKKVQNKSKKEPQQQFLQIDSNNNNDDDDDDDETEADRACEERDAWVRSPIRTRLRSRRAEIAAQSEQTSSLECPNEMTNITERGRKMNPKRSRVRSFLREYELTISHMEDRLDIVEDKIRQLQTNIPMEIGKWTDLQKKFRGDYSGQFDSLPMDSVKSDIPVNDETCLKQLEVDNNLPSVSSGTTSDDIYFVKDKSSSSQEYMQPMCDREQNYVEPTCERSPKSLEDSSLPSGIPSGFGPDERDVVGIDHQTSTPVTERDLTGFKSFSTKRRHALKHTNITTIKLNTSTTQSRHDCNEEKMEMEVNESLGFKKKNVLSPEQLGVKHFLQQRRKSDRKSSSFTQNHSADRSSLYGSPPMASSTFRHGDDSVLASETSPFSFTFRNDFVDCSQASYAKVCDESKVDEYTPNISHQNCSSNLSFTFRNDSQMIATKGTEDLPGYTRNYSFCTPGGRLDHKQGPETDEDCIMTEGMAESGVTIVYTEAQIHERPPDTSMAADTDRTTLTNVTRFTGDFINSFDAHCRGDCINSFDGKANKSRWVNKDVFMFNEAQPRCVEDCKNNRSSDRMDEKGDGCKPPKPDGINNNRNFLTEARDKLKSFRVRHHSGETGVMTVGVCVGNQASISDAEITNEQLPVDKEFVEETIVKKEQNQFVKQAVLPIEQQFLETDTKQNIEDMEHQGEFSEDTLQEFEKMEELCREDTTDHSLTSSSKEYLARPKSQTTVDNDKAAGRSVSRTSSMESKCSAKYHFLHDKGMIKIESPSLKLVSQSPRQRRRKDYNSKNVYEEESTDIGESGNESEVEGYCVDDDFKLSKKELQVRADLGSEVTHSQSDDRVTHSQSDDTMSETSETDTQVIYEQHILDEYLKTVDEGQETWDSVMKWMHKECDDEEGEDLEAELKLMMEQENNPDDNQNGSIYYSFRANSEDMEHSFQEEGRTSSLSGGCHMHDKNRVNQMDHDDDEDNDLYDDEDKHNSIPSPSLLHTIMNGTIEEVETLLNSDRTISESEIKDGLLWALDNKNLKIASLLLEDICKLIRAAEEDNFIEVFAGYCKKDPWKPVFIILSKTHPEKVWDTFMGLPVYRRKYDFVSPEAQAVNNHNLIKSNPLSSSDVRDIEEAIRQANLFKHHSKVTSVRGCAFRSKQDGKELVHQSCIVINCLLKGFIPFGEDPFPQEVNGIPTDVREDCVNMETLDIDIRNSTPGTSDDNNNQLTSLSCAREPTCGNHLTDLSNYHQSYSTRDENGIVSNDREVNGHVLGKTVGAFGVITPKPDEYVDKILYQTTLTHYHTILTFDAPEKEAFRKHCGKSRKCWVNIYLFVNPLPHKEILDWSKLKAFADDKIKVSEDQSMGSFKDMTQTIDLDKAEEMDFAGCTDE